METTSDCDVASNRCSERSHGFEHNGGGRARPVDAVHAPSSSCKLAAGASGHSLDVALRWDPDGKHYSIQLLEIRLRRSDATIQCKELRVPADQPHFLEHRALDLRG